MKQNHRKIFWGTAIILLFTLTLYTQNKEGIKIKKSDSKNTNVIKGDSMKTKIVKSEEDWCRILTPEQYEVLREKGTERAFTGKYYNHKETGIYTCSACGNKLFKSATKYDSGSGWPSFWDVVDKDEVKLIEDRSYGMKRIEVQCKKCDSHLGHVFDDGPEPTGIRYCINSVSLNFIPDDSVKNQK